MQNEIIFVECKIYREDWMGEKLVKVCFVIKEKNVNVYMCGELFFVVIFEKVCKEGKKLEKVIVEDERLVKEIQWLVLKKGYKLVC